MAFECFRDFPSERPEEIKMNSVSMLFGIQGQQNKQVAETYMHQELDILLRRTFTLTFQVFVLISLKKAQYTLYKFV